MAADLSPAPPTDLDELIAAYEQTARAVLELGRTAGPERSGDPTPCPGWDVFAQVAHIESLESLFGGEPLPDLTIEERPHVRNDMGAVVELLIESRRHLSLAELCDRLEDVIDRRVALFRSDDVSAETEMESPFGMMSAVDFLALRSFDIWTHEQDLRETLEIPGSLDSSAASVSMRRMYASLGRIAVASGLPVSQSVVVELTGPVTGRQGVQVVEKDGRVRGVPADVADEDAACVLRLGTREAGRLVAGRDPVGSDGAFGWHWSGDRDVAEGLVRHFAVTP